jgi:hypothetical protein
VNGPGVGPLVNEQRELLTTRQLERHRPIAVAAEALLALFVQDRLICPGRNRREHEEERQDEAGHGLHPEESDAPIEAYRS